MPRFCCSDIAPSSPTSQRSKGISTSVSIGPSACSSRVAARPSQNWAPKKPEVSTVGVLRSPICPSWPTARGLRSVSPSAGLWQVAQEMTPEALILGSKNSIRPSSIRASAFELWLAIGGIAGSGSKKPW
jgi:hypothetical protein